MWFLRAVNIRIATELDSNVWTLVQHCYASYFNATLYHCVITYDYVTSFVCHTICIPPPFMLYMYIQCDIIAYEMHELICMELDDMNKSLLIFTIICRCLHDILQHAVWMRQMTLTYTPQHTFCTARVSCMRLKN
jgi:hypothetical protein